MVPCLRRGVARSIFLLGAEKEGESKLVVTRKVVSVVGLDFVGWGQLTLCFS